MLNLTKKYNISKNVIIKKFENETIIINLQSENIFTLNSSSTKIIDLINNNLSVGEIINKLAIDYEIGSENIKSDVISTIISLISHNIIQEIIHDEN